MTKIYLYAEILTHIRQLSLHASLTTQKREGTKVDVSTDKKVVTVTHDGETQRLYLPTQVKGDASITFPLQKQTEINARVQIEDEHEWKLSINNEIEAPWMASDLTDCTQLQCRHCSAKLVAAGTVTLWKALPPENWAELMDLWFCHKPHDDQSTGDAAAAKGFSSKSRLAVDRATGMIDLISIVLNADDCTNVKAAETLRDPNLTLLRCSNCTNVLGHTNTDEDLVRLHKSSLCGQTTSLAKVLSYPPSLFICAQILSLIESTALKKFLVYTKTVSATDQGPPPPLILWVFNPDIYYSCSASASNKLPWNGIPHKNENTPPDPHPNPNRDDVSQIYGDQTGPSGSGRKRDRREMFREADQINTPLEETSQIYDQPGNETRTVSGDLEFEVPLRHQEPGQDGLSEIAVEPMTETETPLLSVQTTTTSAATAFDASEPLAPSISTTDELASDHMNLVHRAAKIYYRHLPPGVSVATFLDENNTTHEELYLPDEADLASLTEALEGSTRILPASARSFQDWSIGLLDRYESIPSGLGVMQENPLARGIKSKDGRVTRWDLGNGAEGLFS